MKSESLCLCYDNELNPLEDCPDLWGERGVFSTLRVSCASEKIAYFLELHVERILASLAALGIEAFCSAGVIDEALSCFNKGLSGKHDYLVRISMTAKNLSFHGRLAPQASTDLLGIPFLLERENPQLKSLDYLPVLNAIKQSGSGSEALLLNEKGDLLEGATTNLIVCRGEEILFLEKDCLSGITQQLIYEALKKKGYSVRSGELNKQDLAEVSEILLCGTGKEVSSLKEIPEYAWSRTSLKVYEVIQSIYAELKRAYREANLS